MKEEEQIWRACLGGKLKAQEQFYRYFYGYAMSIGLRYSGNREEALEIVNDSFLKIFNNLDKHNPEKSIKAWIRRIVVNTSLDYYRKNQKYRYDIDITEAQHGIVDENTFDRLAVEELLKILQELPPAQRSVFNLYEIEGYSHQEIGEMLGIPEGTSKSHLSRAKNKLRELVEKL